MKTTKMTSTIGQSLMATWKSCVEPLDQFLNRMTEEVRKTGHGDYKKRYPLFYFLKDTYQHRYIPLCRAIGIQPLSFGKWLRQPVNSVI